MFPPHSQSALPLPPPSTITITTSVGRTQDPGHPRSGEHPRAGHLTVLRAERLRPFAFFSLSPSLVLALARSFALVPVLSLAPRRGSVGETPPAGACDRRESDVPLRLFGRAGPVFNRSKSMRMHVHPFASPRPASPLILLPAVRRRLNMTLVGRVRISHSLPPLPLRRVLHRTSSSIYPLSALLNFLFSSQVSEVSYRDDRQVSTTRTRLHVRSRPRSRSRSRSPFHTPKGIGASQSVYTRFSLSPPGRSRSYTAGRRLRAHIYISSLLSCISLSPLAPTSCKIYSHVWFHLAWHTCISGLVFPCNLYSSTLQSFFYVFPPFLSFDPSRLFFLFISHVVWWSPLTIYAAQFLRSHFPCTDKTPAAVNQQRAISFIYSSWLDFLRTLVHIPTPVTLDLRRHHVRLILRSAMQIPSSLLILFSGF
ncbi:hypothetical protein AcW1_001434 [Taiwanofungus camphoratus]|nr:hypothetical protein AcW1_001434 [Antrodia cinnamomea]